jgi:hypothetical protein
MDWGDRFSSTTVQADNVHVVYVGSDDEMNEDVEIVNVSYPPPLFYA